MLFKRDDGVLVNLNRFEAIRVRPNEGVEPVQWQVVGQLSIHDDAITLGEFVPLAACETEERAYQILDGIWRHFNGYMVLPEFKHFVA